MNKTFNVYGTLRTSLIFSYKCYTTIVIIQREIQLKRHLQLLVVNVCNTRWQFIDCYMTTQDVNQYNSISLLLSNELTIRNKTTT